MGRFTAQQVYQAIQSDGYETDFFNEVGSSGWNVPGLGNVIGVDREGGYEGGGEYMSVVFKVGDQLFRMTGSYNSWNASEWDGDLEEVESYQELVTKYRPLKR